VGRIPWSDVTGARIAHYGSQTALLINVKDPTNYLKRGGWFKQISNNITYKMYGSPIILIESLLELNGKDVYNIFSDYYGKYGDPKLNSQSTEKQGADLAL
jgi:hypothetical protein